jgi:peptidoglycan L-alanyl-D-glutamate endopeptidase CwlK
VRCVRRSIVITTQDFGVHEGVRELARQRQLVAAGASRTLDSYHLTGDAVDLVPWIAGRLQWQMPACIQVAIAMREASIHFGVKLTWGAVWDRLLSQLDPTDLDGEIEAYIVRYRKANPPVLVNGVWKRRDPLIDGPHFQGERRAA